MTADWTLRLDGVDPTLILPWERKPGSLVVGERDSMPELREALATLVYDAHSTNSDVGVAIEYVRSKYVRRQAIPWNAFGEAVAAVLLAPPFRDDEALDPRELAAWPLVDRWVAEAGGIGAIDALLAEASLSRGDLELDVTDPLTHSLIAWRNATGKWARLRAHLCSMPDSDYTRAVEHAERLRAGASEWQRCAFSYLFPERSEWAASDAQACRATTPAFASLLARNGWLLLLLPSLTDLGLIRDVLTRALAERAYDDGRFLTLLVRFGRPAAELLLEIAEGKLSMSGHRAMGCLEVVEAGFIADRAAALLGRPQSVEAARDYLSRYPRLAVPALRRFLQSTPRVVVAKALLRDLIEEHPELDTGDLDKVSGKRPPRKSAVASDAKSTTPRGAKSQLPRGVQQVVNEPDGDLPPEAREVWQRACARIRAHEPVSDELCALARVEHTAAPRRIRQLVTSWGAAEDLDRARDGILALAAGETDGCIGQLAALRDSPVDRAVSSAAASALAVLVKQRALSDDDLEDRKVDDFGLAGNLVLDLGTRHFRIILDAQMEVRLADDDGTPRKDFPARRKSDDAARYETAKTLWQRIRSEGSAELRHQAKRFETAMIEERRWTAPSFARAVVAHPLLGILARRIVWRSVADAPCSFRVAEDGTLADERDEPFSLSSTVQVEIPHPLTLTAALPRWAEIFGDYEIVQPFDQLGREIFSEADANATLRAAPTRTLSTKARFVLENLGWTEGEYAYGGWTGYKTLRGHALQITLHGGFDTRPTFTLTQDPPDPDWRKDALDDLDAIGRSEILRDLVKSGLKA